MRPANFKINLQEYNDGITVKLLNSNNITVTQVQSQSNTSYEIDNPYSSDNNCLYADYGDETQGLGDYGEEQAETLLEGTETEYGFNTYFLKAEMGNFTSANVTSQMFINSSPATIIAPQQTISGETLIFSY